MTFPRKTRTGVGVHVADGSVQTSHLDNLESEALVLKE